MASSERKKLISWYLLNKRDLPWRNTRNPYHIWISEIVLQQTQVIQGLSYYERLIAAFPNVAELAAADEDQVLKLWQGLGYYSRARNMHASAKQIMASHGGKFPANYDSIRALRGVGDYTAAAIASFAFNLPHVVVDGNVSRFISRYYGIEAPIDTSAGKKLVWRLAQDLLDRTGPAQFNQAIMEFGSQHCKPSNPDCGSCIFSRTCFANKHDVVKSLPVKSVRVKVRERHFNYLVLADNQGRILVNKRKSKDIWHGLYEFTLLETPEKMDRNTLFGQKRVRTLCGPDHEVRFVSEPYVHILSHQKLHCRFVVVKANTRFRPENSVESSSLNTLALPRLIDRFLADCQLGKIIL